MRRWLSWPKAHDWKSCVRGTVPRVQIPLSAPTLQAWLEANQKSGRTAQAPLPFFVSFSCLRFPLVESIGHRNRDGSLRSPIPSSQSSSLQIPLSAPTLRATAQSMPQKRQERNKVPLSLFVPSPMPRPALR